MRLRTRGEACQQRPPSASTPHVLTPSSLPPLQQCPSRGRTKFYDQYGVIRDVHQNHLTEILALVAMEVGAPGDDLDTTEKQVQAKLAILRGLRTADLQHTVLGQYEGYKDHVRQDHKGAARGTRAMAWKMEEEKSLLRRVVAVSPNAPAFLFFFFLHFASDDALDSATPTFAAASLSIDHPRWKKTPFILVAGKEVCRCKRSVGSEG